MFYTFFRWIAWAGRFHLCNNPSRVCAKAEAIVDSRSGTLNLDLIKVHTATPLELSAGVTTSTSGVVRSGTKTVVKDIWAILVSILQLSL